ncbi:39S ribosomal protein L16, mitochondrial [Lamellibrachia satsuma]|nr:39S ribosomal protein L16, mitochondrial [Lamellibrachia satsuma]
MHRQIVQSALRSTRTTSALLKQNSINLVADVTCPLWRMTPVACVASWKHPKNSYEGVEFPERRKLTFVEKAPVFTGNQRPQKMFKRLIDMRGPEIVHNALIHKQYGIRAIHGGTMKPGHFEMVRNTTNRKLEENRMFAVWRLDPPWKSITKKGQGHRMGSGKGSIDHYVTPVRAGRIIIEMGGHLEFQEAAQILKRVADKLPFKAEAVSQQMLEEEVHQSQLLAQHNLNPFSFQYCVDNNMLGCRKWLSTYDYKWYNKYR